MKTDAPFPGLVPFEESDAWLFHGREDEARVISANLHAERLTLLFGESGAGKSSLLNAGVAAETRERTKEDAARWGRANFAVATMRTWSGDPVRELIAAVREAVPGADGGDLESVLRAASGQLDGHLLVILDQFEEYFRYLDDGKVDRAFLDEFGALWSRDLRVNFLLALREDSLGVLDRLKGRIPNPYENYLRLEHLSVAGARDAILKPIKACGKAVTFPPALADRVLARILGKEATDKDRLQASILQLVMRRWWDATPSRVFDEAGLAKLGGVENIVRDHLLESLTGLTPEQAKLAAAMFVPLVTESGRKIANTDRELAGAVGSTVGVVRAVADPLVAKRILSTTALPPKAQSGDVCYEFRHDLLAAAALGWRKEREKEEAERKAATERRRVTVLSFALAAALLAFFFAGWMWITARNNARFALVRHLAAQSQSVLTEEDDGLEKAVLLAIESTRRHPSFEGDRTLRRSLGILPRTVSRVAPGNWLDRTIHSIVFSPDGKSLGSAGTDGDVRVIEASTGRKLLTIANPDHGPVFDVAFSPNGDLLAIAGFDGAVRVIEVATGRSTTVAKHDRLVYAVAFSPNGRWLATASGDRNARVVDAKTGRKISRLAHGGEVTAVAFGPNGKLVATASADGTSRVFEAGTGTEVSRLAHASVVYAVDFGPDGQLVATASNDGTARVFEARTGHEVSRHNHGRSVHSIKFSPDGKRIATGSSDLTARVVESATGREVSRLKHGFGDGALTLRPGDRALPTVFSPDGKRVASGGSDRTARIMEAATGRELARVTHAEEVSALAFSPDGKWVASGSRDGEVRITEASAGYEISTVRGSAAAVAFSPDGKWVATGGPDRAGRISESTSGREVSKWVHDDAVLAVAFSSDGRFVGSGSQDKTARVLDAATGREVARFVGDQVVAVAFSPDGKWVANALATDSTIQMMDLAKSRVFPKPSPGPYVSALAFSLDGKLIASGGGNLVNMQGHAVVVETATGRVVSRLTHGAQVRAVAISPDGKWLATGSLDHTSRVMDVATGREVAKVTHASQVGAVAFSADGKLVATGSMDRTARVIETATGTELNRLAHAGTVRALWFPPDAAYLVTAFGSSDDTVISRHPLRPADLIQDACSRVTRNLTLDEWKQYLGDEPYRKTCPNLP